MLAAPDDNDDNSLLTSDHIEDELETSKTTVENTLTSLIYLHFTSNCYGT